MNGTENEQPGSSREEMQQNPTQTPDKEFNVSGIIKWEFETGNPGLEPSSSPRKLPVQIERFSSLSSDITRLLSELSEEVKNSMNQLQGIQLAVDLKKKELKTLHDIDVSATALEGLIEDHRLQRESLESQRNAWEEEKAKRIQEEKEYLEDLNSRRQREEEEYRQMWAAEQQEARQKLDEELKAAQQKSLEELGALEKDCLGREQMLKEKELEWLRLVQELEQFVSKLSSHTRPQAAAPNAGLSEKQDSEPVRFSPKEFPSPDF